MSKIFFTADTHFGHANILKYASRPFADVDEMDEELIARWNARVGPNDEIYHLGDVSFRKSAQTVDVLKRLNGKKYLVKGNHDRISPEVERQWAWIKDYHELKIADHHVVLCHFPFEAWNRSHHASWHLHGHAHGHSTRRPNRMDVGVDVAWGPHALLDPWSEEEISEFMKENQ